MKPMLETRTLTMREGLHKISTKAKDISVLALPTKTVHKHSHSGTGQGSLVCWLWSLLKGKSVPGEFVVVRGTGTQYKHNINPEHHSMPECKEVHSSASGKMYQSIIVSKDICGFKEFAHRFLMKVEALLWRNGRVRATQNLCGIDLRVLTQNTLQSAEHQRQWSLTQWTNSRRLTVCFILWQCLILWSRLAWNSICGPDFSRLSNTVASASGGTFTTML